MADHRYHVRLEDPSSGEELGLMLTEAPQLGFTRRLVNPYAAKAGQGETQDSDLTEWSLVSWRDWRGGRGQEDLEDKSAFYDSQNVETRIKEQVTLGPLPQQPTGTYPKYEPGDVAPYVVGFPLAEQWVHGSTEWTMGPGSFTKLGQRFKVEDIGGDSNRWIKSVDVYVKKVSASSALRVSIYDESGGYPDSEQVYKEVAAADIESNWHWENFEFSSPLQVTAGSHYWILITVTTGTYMTKGSWGGYAEGFVLSYTTRWGVYRSRDLRFRVRYQRFARSMSFECPAGGITCTSVQLLLAKRGHPGTYTCALHADDGGEPASSALTSTTFDGDSAVGTVMGWTEVEWDSGQALTGGSTYHIVLTPPSTEVVSGGEVTWGGDSAAGYASGSAHRKRAAGSWAASTPDLYFRINTEVLDDDVIAFELFNSKWYCAAGDTVYEWNSGTSDWDVSDQQGGKTITALEAWGDYLWAGRGSDHVLRRYDGSSWADVSSTYAKLLHAGGGYLHRSNGVAGSEHEVYYTADGSTWSSAIEVGTSAFEITGMAWYRDMLVCATAVRLWGTAADLAYPVLDWHSQEDGDNGKGMLAWSKTGCLYIPLLFGLYRWNGDTMVAVGPEQGMGLPANRAGKIRALCGTGNWLYAAIDAGASGYSSIMAYGGRGGWHELQRAEQTGQRTKAVGFETLSSPSRLWYGLSDETRYLQLPDYSDNPWQYSGFEFYPRGDFDTSWVGGDLLEIVKDLHEVVVRGENLAGGRPIDVYYEVDRSGFWTYLGRVENSPRDALSFSGSGFSTKTIDSGSTRSTIELASGSDTTDMEAGDWVRINEEVRQVASVTDSDTFVLEGALSSPPLADDSVYAARPAGREFRLKVVLSTNDRTETPKVKAVFVRYQNNVLDRFVYQLQIRVEDGMTDLGGATYPLSAVELREQLHDWARRSTPFTLYDPDGEGSTVKVISMGEGGFTRKEGAMPPRYASVYSVNLVEVG